MAREKMMIYRGFRKYRKTAFLVLSAITLVISVSTLAMKHASAQENPEQTFTLQLKNADIHSLIETVSIRTGRNFIVDPRVNATVNVVSPEPINTEKLYEIFLSVLQIHGYAAVQAGPITKIIPTPVGVQSAVPLLSEGSNSGDELVSEVIHLERVPALQVVEALRPLLPESATLSAESTSNTVVITDRAANIEKIIELITKMDDR